MNVYDQPLLSSDETTDGQDESGVLPMKSTVESQDIDIPCK